MKNLCLTFYLAIAALLASVGGGFSSDLPRCSFDSNGYLVDTFIGLECFGNSVIRIDGAMTTTTKGVFRWFTSEEQIKWSGPKVVKLRKELEKKGNISLPWTSGYRLHGQGTVETLFWDSGKTESYSGGFAYGTRHGFGTLKKTDGTIQRGIFKKNTFQYAAEPPQTSILRTTFKKLSKNQRRLLQSNLKGLGFYKSSIDGLYGKGTASALTAYNKQNLNGADLKNQENGH